MSATFFSPEKKFWEKRSQPRSQGCQMVYFSDQTSRLGIFWSTLEWKMLVHFTAVLYDLWLFGIVCSHLVYFSHLDEEKSGNPARRSWLSELLFETPENSDSVP
jgi:hypothetical protein